MAAITDYHSLQDAVTQYLVNTDEAGMFDTFLGLAENRFNRELRISEMVGSDKTSASSTSATFDLGDDFIEAVAVYSTTDTTALSYLPPNKFFNLKSAHGSPVGKPEYYTIIGNTMHFAPYGTAATVTVVPYVELSGLPSSNTTNSIMPKAANLYLYGVLLEAQPFLNEPGRIQEFESFYDRAKSALIAADSRKRLRPGVGQRMRSSGVTADGVFRIP